MQAGFAALCAGAVRRKNVANTMLKNLLDACGAAIAFAAIGFAFSYGDGDSSSSTFVGTKHFFLQDDVDPAFFFFQFAFSATAVTIVAGTLAERCQMAAYLCYSFILTGFIYPVVAHAICKFISFIAVIIKCSILLVSHMFYSSNLSLYMCNDNREWKRLFLYCQQ